jgi:hypothetical protein
MSWGHPLHVQTRQHRLRLQKVLRPGQVNSLREVMRGLFLAKAPVAVVAAPGGPVWALATPEAINA